MAIDRPLIIRAADTVEGHADDVIIGLERALSKFEKLMIANADNLAVANSAEIALAQENIKQLLVESGYYREVGRLVNDEYAAAINESSRLYKKMYNKSMRFSDKSTFFTDPMRTV